MPDIWGLLPKSAIDNETIEEAIARLIVEHEEDPDSHLGAGESLAAHKADEVLDHPAQSVLYDKFSANELIFQTFFENESSFSVVGSPGFQYPGFNLHPNGGSWAGRDEVSISGEERGLAYNLGKALRFQFSFFGEAQSPSTFRFMASSYAGQDEDRGIGLEVIDGVARFFFAENNGDNPVYLDWEDWEQAEYYVIRIEYDPVEEKAYYYANSVLIGSLSAPDPTNNDILVFDIQCHTSIAGRIDFNVSSLSFQLEP